MSTAGTARGGWAVAFAIYLAAACAYVVLGTLNEILLVFPDEMIYGHLARSVADGDGLSWYGAHETRPTALFIYLLAPSWIVTSGESAYELAKITGALVLSTVVFPTWLLATRLLPGRLAPAVPTVLTVAGTWMLSAAGLLTENLALPLTTAALVCTAIALGEPSPRWRWAALAFTLLATFSRAQMAALFAIMLAAALLDGAFAEQPSERLKRNRIEIVVLAAIVTIGVVLVLSGSTAALGPYVGVSNFAPSAQDVIEKSVQQWVALAVMAGVVPVAGLLALAARPRAWREDRLGPVLCVTVPTVVLLAVESGFFIAGYGSDLSWNIERYGEYALPLLFVLLFAGIQRGAIRAPALGAASAFTALTLLATADVRQPVEQRATYATSKLIDGLVGAGLVPALLIGALLVAGGATVLVARLPPARATYAVGALLLLAFVIQSQWTWRWQADFTKQIRAQYPNDLSWVDDNARAPVTRLYVSQNSDAFQRLEPFNETIAQVLVPPNPRAGPPPIRATCGWTPDNRGTIQVTGGCGPVKSRIWNDDPFNVMTFHGGRLVARDPHLGQIIAVPPQPRLRSVVRPPCPPLGLVVGRDGALRDVPADFACPATMSVFLWVDSPGTLELTFQGGTREQRVGYGSHNCTLKPGRRTVVRVPVTTPTSLLRLRTPWAREVGTRLVDAEFVGGAGRERLL